jgi:4-hydroxybenzoate polyprenyltransferase
MIEFIPYFVGFITLTFGVAFGYTINQYSDQDDEH